METSELEGASRRLRSLAFEHLRAATAVLADDGTIVDTNETWRRAAEENGGDPDRTGPGVNYLQVCDRAAAAGSSWGSEVAAGLRSLLAGTHRSFELEYPCHSPTEKRWFVLQAVAMGDTTAEGIVVSHVDITERKLLEQRLAVQARHDELTGLPNRRAAIEFLEAALGVRMEPHELVVVLFADLDGFKEVNDTFGHEAGDDLLVQVAGRMRAAVRDGDMVARLGGDEFVVVCPRAKDPDGSIVAGRLRDAIEEPYRWRGREINVGVSIGSAQGSTGTTVDALFRGADTGMYRDKDERSRRTT